MNFKIGLTGGIGAGKSTVANVWKSLGAAIVEGDQMGRLALESPSVINALADRFGKEIISLADGSIDRRALGKVAFSSASGRKDLITLTFPKLYLIAKEHFLSAQKQGKIVVFDAALIYEWGIEADFDLIVVVNAPEKRIIKRAATMLNTTTENIRNRISAQLPAEEKKRRADQVIENDDNLDELIRKAKKLWKELELMT